MAVKIKHMAIQNHVFSSGHDPAKETT
jgi:hypothetical protein